LSCDAFRWRRLSDFLSSPSLLICMLYAQSSRRPPEVAENINNHRGRIAGGLIVVRHVWNKNGRKSLERREVAPAIGNVEGQVDQRSHLRRFYCRSPALRPRHSYDSRTTFSRAIIDSSSATRQILISATAVDRRIDLRL
jgi:hypothetical protein